MAFKLTYSDGQESQHDDDTVWELDDGVLKLGREKGKWSVLLSPSHWAVLELGGQAKDDDKDAKGEGKKDKKSDTDKSAEAKSDKDAKDEDTDDESTKDKDTDKKDADKKDGDES